MKFLKLRKKSHKNKKASDFDSISSKMLECNMGELGSIIFKLFNNILESK